MKSENHILPDVLQPNLKIVFCGMAAGNESARRKAYYAGPGNKFWRTLYQVGLTPHLLNPTDFRLLPEYGLGLTDIAKYTSGNDNALSKRDYDGIALYQKIEEFQPLVMAFNGKNGAKIFFKQMFNSHDHGYGLKNTVIGTTKLYILPSTSGAANGFWNIDYWHELAACVD